MKQEHSKQPWEMTFTEYSNQPEYAGISKPSVMSYQIHIERALQQGKPVPAEVLAKHHYHRTEQKT